MNTQINKQNVEGNNVKNQEVELKNLSSSDFFRIRDAVIEVQCKMIKKGNKEEGKKLGDTWLKIEYAYYHGLPNKGDE